MDLRLEPSVLLSHQVMVLKARTSRFLQCPETENCLVIISWQYFHFVVLTCYTLEIISIKKCNKIQWQILRIFKKILFLFIFRERGRKGEREGEKHQCVAASCVPPTGDLSCNPGMCPGWESNQRPFDLQAGTQSTEPHQPGLGFFF